MTHEKALELLELEEGASTQEIRSAYQEFFNELNIRLTNAPTDHQKQLYTRRLQDIEKAYLLLGDMSQDDINEMPSISPVEISEEEQTRQVQENAKTNTTATITEAQALKMLALKIPFSADMLENTYRKKKRDLEAGMKSSPNAKAKEAYQEEIDKLSQAHTLLLPKAQAKEKKKLPLGILAAIGVVLLILGVLALWQPWKGKDSIDSEIDLVTKEEFIKHKSQADLLAEKQDWSHALDKYQAAYALIADAEVSDSIASMENRIAAIANDSKAKEAAEAEAKDWKAAQKANTTAAYLDFIKKYPSGTHTSQAEQKIKDLENTYSANNQAEAERKRAEMEEAKKALIITVNGRKLEVSKEDLGKMNWNDAKNACEKLGDGWRLPTKEELNQMYNQLHQNGKGGFASASYWSSTEFNSLNFAWIQSFDGGYQSYFDKSSTLRVRAVRAF